MSLLISDSLVGLVDEETLMGGFDFLGEVTIDGSKYRIDAFVADQKTIRFYAVAPHEIALKLLDLKAGNTVKMSLGDVFEAEGKIIQIGWDDTPRGGRVILCMAR
jgi:hypothetical protein